ncbi:hypothetical protein [Pseudorhodobacter sp.]|uniref:hypothetical protein n=1 Tax=Pseudorhodobacter sp. TaxID=1934400 RepID=UPI0026484360|nr:hypothetical protein [Pseudorhodobacter sp.]MDN5785584.1 hypothetical protein [Pseudorhodobacter sp.]
MSCPAIGHNNGPTLEPGGSWRKHCWVQARKALLPHLPIEVLRGRLRRAAELGLDYSTYAGIRATTGCDVVAVLFSSNALRLHNGKSAPPAIARKMAQTMAIRTGLATDPLSPQAMLQAAPLDAAFAAPAVHAGFSQTRNVVRTALGRTPADQTILIGAYGAEAEWTAGAPLAGYVEAAAYFR